MQFPTLALAALASLASAQKMWVVTVGMNGTLTYSPDSLTAAVGDSIQFQFVAGNHTATQAAFTNPCEPIADHSNVAGFYSGFQPAAASAAMGMVSTYTVNVTSTTPIWVYCAQAKHCQSGMVMVVNEDTSSNKTLAAFKAAAAKVATTVIPGNNATTGGSSGSTTTSGSSGSSTTGSTAAGATGGAVGISTPSTVGLLAVIAAAIIL